MGAVRTVRWEEMLPYELERAVAECPVAWISFGCLELHGPHMAVGTDALNAHAICTLAAERYGGVVAPASYWHMGGGETEAGWKWWVSWGSPKMWGLFITPDIYYPLFIALLRQAEMLGFRVVMAIAGHGGGPEHDTRIIAEHYMRTSPLKVCAMGWWEGLSVPVTHGGAVEASCLWHFRPGLVDMTRLPEDRSTLVMVDQDCDQASPEHGRHFAETAADSLGRKALDLLSQYVPWPDHQTMGREDIIPLWEQIKRTEAERLVEWP